jgi:hypothetical protein
MDLFWVLLQVALFANTIYMFEVSW